MKVIKDYIANLPAILIENEDIYEVEDSEVTSINGKRISQLFPGERPVVTFDDDYRFPKASKSLNEGVIK